MLALMVGSELTSIIVLFAGIVSSGVVGAWEVCIVSSLISYIGSDYLVCGSSDRALQMSVGLVPFLVPQTMQCMGFRGGFCCCCCCC